MLPNKNWSLLYDRLDSSLYTLHNIHPQGAVKKVPKKKGCDLAKKQDSSLFLWYN